MEEMLLTNQSQDEPPIQVTETEPSQVVLLIIQQSTLQKIPERFDHLKSVFKDWISSSDPLNVSQFGNSTTTFTKTIGELMLISLT